MSARSLAREREKGRGWSDEQRARYREERRAKKFGKEVATLRATQVSRAKIVEAPIDSEMLEF